MKYSEVIQAAPRCLLRRDQATLRVGAAQLFVLMERYKWIKPVLRKHRMTLFDSRDVDHCIERIAFGEYPGADTRPSMSRSEGDK
jgi:hypothetical protein